MSQHNQYSYFGTHIQDENQSQQQNRRIGQNNKNSQFQYIHQQQSRQPVLTKVSSITQQQYQRPVLQDLTNATKNTSSYVFGGKQITQCNTTTTTSRGSDFSMFSHQQQQHVQQPPFSQNGNRSHFAIKNGKFVTTQNMLPHQVITVQQQQHQQPYHTNINQYKTTTEMDLDDDDEIEEEEELDEELDANDLSIPFSHIKDPAQQCYEYVNDIYNHMRSVENRYLPRPNYMREKQTDINPSMRGILVDWLNEVCQEYKLKLETLYLAVNIVDRTLSHFVVKRGKLQMVGVTALFISAKYNELAPPTVDDFVFITDNTYPKADILNMETLILNSLEFNITIVSSVDFLVRFLRAANANELCYHLSFFLTELTLQDYSMIKYLPSAIATSAVVLSLHTLRSKCFPDALRQLTGFSGADIRDCVTEMLRLYQDNTSNLAAVKTKYSRSAHQRVSMITVPTNAPDLT